MATAPPQLGLLLPGPYLGRPLLPAGRVPAGPEQPPLGFCGSVWCVAEVQACAWTWASTSSPGWAPGTPAAPGEGLAGLLLWGGGQSGDVGSGTVRGSAGRRGCLKAYDGQACCATSWPHLSTAQRWTPEPGPRREEGASFMEQDRFLQGWECVWGWGDVQRLKMGPALKGPKGQSRAAHQSGGLAKGFGVGVLKGTEECEADE